jgi:hypothetical protein
MSGLRTVSWNCRDGLTEDKPEAIQKFGADILVIRECSQKDWEGLLKTRYGASSDWHGDGKDSNGSPGRNRGVFVLCREGLKLEKLYKCDDVKYRYVPFFLKTVVKNIKKRVEKYKIIEYTQNKIF